MNSPSIVYIKQAEASFIARSMILEGEYLDKRKEILQYQGSMTNSIQFEYYKKIANKTSIKEKKGHFYCDDFISVTFDNSLNLKEQEIKKTKKEIREYLYSDGFIHNGIKYVRYQRSSGSARLGNCLFINEKYYNKMIKFSNMDLNISDNEPCDIASLFAYQSLTLSTKIDDIIILPEEILLVNDEFTEFESMASVTRINEKGKINVYDEIYKHRQDIWDGQSLLDESIFVYHGYDNKGMLLLRNHFFKSACFNTNIQKYYKDNNIEFVTDMFGKKMKANKIKLITTPNSIKALKFAYKMKLKNNQEEQMYEYWKSKIVDFGLVKYEKPSKFGSYNRTAYQMINSLDFSRDDIKELMKEEIEYINLINDKPSVFKHRLSISQPKTNYSFIMNMITINDDIQYTKLYKDARRKVIESHKKKLLRGQIRIPNTDYFTMVSMPYEMLQHSAFGRWEPVLVGKQIYTKYYENLEELTGFRNPHILSSNVALLQNINDKRFDEYFNFSNNIVIMNCWDNDITARLQGADWDSDTVLLTSNKIILEKAKLVVGHPTPVNGIDASKIQRYYETKSFSDVDFIISTNKIGEIVNLSQLFNSHYWMSKNELDKKIYFNCSSMLSSLSQIEIDKAKKLFDFSIVSAMNHIKKISEVNTNVKPFFFKYIVENPEKCEFMKFETPMDYVVDEVRHIRGANRSKNISISKFLKYDSRKATHSQVERLGEIAHEVQIEINKIKSSNKTKSEKYKLSKQYMSFFVDEFKSKTMTKETMCEILRRSESSFSEFKNIIINLICELYPTELKDILVNSIENRRIIEQNTDGDIVIFGKKYAEIAK